MNRKGFIDITWLFIILIVIVALAMAQQGLGTHSQEQLINALNWTKIGGNVSQSLQHSIDTAEKPWVAVVLSICQKGVDLFGYTIFELGKLAVKVAIENPNIINYKVLFGLLILSLLAPLIYPAFIIVVSIFLIVKEWIQVRREKRELNDIMKKEVNNGKVK